MLKIMFLCTGNSCRSQMAEGLARVLGGAVVEPYSAGLMPVGVNPHAIAVMREIGIDISHQRSKAIDETLLMGMDLVVTLCDNAAEACPVTPQQIKRLHWPVRDPVGTTGTDAAVMQDFRRARDEIRDKIHHLLTVLRTEQG